MLSIDYLTGEWRMAAYGDSCRYAALYVPFICDDFMDDIFM